LNETLNKIGQSDPLVIIEQKYKIYDQRGERLFGISLDSKDENNASLRKKNSSMNSNYCSVGADHSRGRDLVECHYKACLYAGKI
jgi:hypothetical protein